MDLNALRTAQGSPQQRWTAKSCGESIPIKPHSIASGLRLQIAEVLRSLRHSPAADTKPKASHYRSHGGEGPRVKKKQHSTTFFERTREGYRQSGEHWNCFKGNTGENPERLSDAHMYIFERIDSLPSRTELSSQIHIKSSCLRKHPQIKIYELSKHNKVQHGKSHNRPNKVIYTLLNQAVGKLVTLETKPTELSATVL